MASVTDADAAAESAHGGLNYIEHRVSKMDTLAGVAIKYGVEVADIKRMNGLATDFQMFALKSLQIPLPGRHPPSSRLYNGSVSLGERTAEKTPPRICCSKMAESYQSPRLKSPQRNVSSAMNSLQNYYGLKTPNVKGAAEGTEMAIYRTERSHFSGNGSLPKASPISDPPIPRNHKYGNVANPLSPENGIATEDVSRAGESEKSNDKSIRRRQKVEADTGSSIFSALASKGLALRPKSASRASLVSDDDSVSVGLEDSFTGDGISGVRKSSSTSSLQDQEGSNSSSVWPTSKWNLKPDFQALSSSAIGRPLFDGLPKPITGLWNKAARD